MQFSGERWQNNRLASPPWRLEPPCLGNPGSATGHLCIAVFTARIQRMGKGYIFTLCVSPHPLPGQQCEYVPCSGRYASCVHAGGLSRFVPSFRRHDTRCGQLSSASRGREFDFDSISQTVTPFGKVLQL